MATNPVVSMPRVDAGKAGLDQLKFFVASDTIVRVRVRLPSVVVRDAA
ncbi:hypothetical protein [Defluviicoccus vanus]|uniref:Uncharacterized protein n=1 Tax=Defluviicoccus vanus TaxID=111831 RepID=A0A7H1N3E4_9PROT|nr:hypothetical protein [Defluviicoccus vanus]QNT70230.1 hypothetical protein HQ394_13960 [Defluviicoccus vanus]